MIDQSTVASCLNNEASPLDRMAARLVLRQLERWHVGALTIELPNGRALEVGVARAARRVTVAVRRWRFFRRLLTGGDIAVGEAFMDGDWECGDLVELCRMFVEDQTVLTGSWLPAWPLRMAHRVQQLARANTLGGSRRNIGRHYDLSNELFQLFLDDSMTYSAGVFEQPDATLEDAQRAKIDGVCRSLGLQPDQHVLEIGSGWGSFAIHAAREYGCSPRLRHTPSILARCASSSVASGCSKTPAL